MTLTIENERPEDIRIVEELIKRAFWNVNFPGCALEDFKGILRGRSICKTCLYDNKYTQERLPDGSLKLTISGKPVSPDTVPEGCDVRAVLDGYISIGKVRSMVL